MLVTQALLCLKSNHSPQFLDDSGSKIPIGRVLSSDSSSAQQSPNIWEFLWVHLWVCFEWNQSLDDGLSEVLPCAESGCTTCSSRNKNKKEQNKEALIVPLLELIYGLLLSSDSTPSGPSVHLQTWTQPVCVCYYMNTKWLGSGSLGGVLAWHAKVLDLVPRSDIHELGRRAYALNSSAWEGKVILYLYLYWVRRDQPWNFLLFKTSSCGKKK